MSSGSRDLASEFIDGVFSEDEVFSMPILDGAPEDSTEMGFGDGAGVSSLNAVLQWQEREILEAFAANIKDDITAQGMGVYAEAAPRTSALQPACMQYSVPESWPNTRGLVQEQLAPLARHAPASAYNVISIRRSVKRRRAPGRCIPNAGPLLDPGTRPRRRRRQVNVPKTASVFEQHPVGVQSSAANTSIVVEDLQTVFRHPFDPSIIPVVKYSVNSANEAQASPIRARPRTFSAPPIYSTSVTVPNPIRPVQEAQDPTAVYSQCDIPPLSVKDMECHLKSFDQTTVMNSTYGGHAHDEAPPEPMDTVMNGDLGCQGDLYNPSSTTFTGHGPAQQAELVPFMGVHHGCALGADMEHPILIDSSSALSDCAICDQDLREPIDSISSPANRFLGVAALANPENLRTPRLSWTPELVYRFESAIAILGGPEKATPKAIQRCMAVPGVSILNVKSRLQKFRIQAGVPVDTSRGMMRNRAAPTVARARTPVPDETLEAEAELLNSFYETCKGWSNRLEAQNDHMRHLLAEHHSQTEAANYNAMVLEMYAARIGAAAVVPNFDQVGTVERVLM